MKVERTLFKINQSLNFQFSFLHCGFECKAVEIKNHPYERHVLTYVTSGEGYYAIDGIPFHVKKGDLFFTPSRRITQIPDKKNPWEYFYVAVEGVDCEEMFKNAGFTPQHPIIPLNDEDGAFIVRKMRALCEEGAKDSVNAVLKMRIAFLQILERLYAVNPQNEIGQEDKRLAYVEAVKRFIEEHYRDPITVQDISEHLHLARTYISRVFKEICGVPIKKYLNDYRITKACYYLRATDMPVSKIATEVGYDELTTFSRCFKQRVKYSPKYYRYWNKK